MFNCEMDSHQILANIEHNRAAGQNLCCCYIRRKMLRMNWFGLIGWNVQDESLMIQERDFTCISLVPERLSHQRSPLWCFEHPHRNNSGLKSVWMCLDGNLSEYSWFCLISDSSFWLDIRKLECLLFFTSLLFTKINFKEPNKLVICSFGFSVIFVRKVAIQKATIWLI